MTAPTGTGMRAPSHLAMWLIAFAFTSTNVGGALPTPLYPAYAQRFGFGPLTVTLVFAMYAVGVLSALLGFGRASDLLGRRPVLLVGLAAAASSSAIFLVAGGMHSGGLALLYIGRVLSGMSAGIFAGTATAALTDLAGPEHRARASIVAAVVSVGGIGLGPLICGLLARYADNPLRTPYLLHLVLVLLAAGAVLAVREPVSRAAGSPRWRFQRLSVPTAGRGAFVEAGTASFAGFALLGMFTSVCPAMLALLGHHNPALTGVVVFVVFAASVAGQLASVRLRSAVALLGGTAGLIAALALVAASLAASSLALLVAGGVVGGAAQGAGFRSALELVTSMSPPDQRGAVASSFFAVSYIGLSIPVVGIGLGTRAYGLVHTGEAFTAVLAVLCVLALASLSRRLARSSDQPPRSSPSSAGTDSA